MLMPILFQWSKSYQLFEIIIKRTVVHFRSYGNRRRLLFRFIKQRNKNFACFHFIYRYSPIWTLLSLSWRFYRTNAARLTWRRGTLITVYYSASRQLDLYSPSSRSRRFISRHGFTNNFIWMGRRYYIGWAKSSSIAGWVYFWCASW